MLDSIRGLFSTDGFPPRWQCGTGWTSELGWTHIISDIATWASYTAIPIVLAVFVLSRKDAPFPRIFWLFIAFIFLCGTVHLIEAIIFWYPIYRFSALVKLATGLVSVATVVALIPAIPKALSLRSPAQLEREVEARTRSLQESTARQQMLMSELDHRVKNNIAAIMSLADQTLASTQDPTAFREAFIGRLRAMARTHESLSTTKWGGAQLHTIVALTLEPYQEPDIERVTIDGSDLRLDAKASNAVCLAIHELATNSVKYGSLSVPEGSIQLSWSEDEHGAQITWVEQNGPPVRPPERPGFGTLLIQGMISHDIDGRITIDYREAGLVCRMQIPLSRVVNSKPSDGDGMDKTRRSS